MKNYLEGFFWYSEKQEKIMTRLGDSLKFCQLNDGRIVRYTELTDKDKPAGSWDDYIPLGRGRWHHNESE